MLVEVPGPFVETNQLEQEMPDFVIHGAARIAPFELFVPRMCPTAEMQAITTAIQEALDVHFPIKKSYRKKQDQPLIDFKLRDLIRKRDVRLEPLRIGPMDVEIKGEYKRLLRHHKPLSKRLPS